VNLADLKRVEDVHCYGVRALVGEVTANPAAKSFISLADVNGFAVVVIECIYAPLDRADALAFIIQRFEERLDFLADEYYVSRRTERV
jgi:hypothetical protein